MSVGYIYILSNASMPGMLKIGFTTTSPEKRAEELSSTGVPVPYDVEYWHYTLAPGDVEHRLHEIFKAHRVNAKREFFRVNIEDVIRAIELHVKVPTTFSFRRSPTAHIIESVSPPAKNDDTANHSQPAQTDYGEAERLVLTMMAAGVAPFDKDLFRLPDVLGFLRSEGLGSSTLKHMLTQAPFKVVQLPKAHGQSLWAWRNTKLWILLGQGSQLKHYRTGKRPEGHPWSEDVPPAIVEAVTSAGLALPKRNGVNRNEWETIIERYITHEPSRWKDKLGTTWTQRPAPLTQTTSAELLEHALGLDPGRWSQPDQRRVAAACMALGWHQAVTKIDRRSTRVWRVPKSAAQQESVDSATAAASAPNDIV